MLDAQGIGKEYPSPTGNLAILSDINLQVLPGESVSIIGPSGSGKSTLLYILGALETPSTGIVLLDGQNPADLPEDALAAFRNKMIGFVFQDHHLLPQCSVLENVLIPTMAGTTEDQGTRDRARELLDAVGLGPRTTHRPPELSGGEKQRVALARALIQNPRLILCDEPTGNLDDASTETVTSLLLELHQREASILVVVTHNLDLAARFQRRYRLQHRRLEPL